MDAFILSKIPGSEQTETTGYLAQQDLFDLVRSPLLRVSVTTKTSIASCRAVCSIVNRPASCLRFTSFPCYP
jgi:hypothetical protein